MKRYNFLLAIQIITGVYGRFHHISRRDLLLSTATGTLIAWHWPAGHCFLIDPALSHIRRLIL
jgi:hypothetical protein